MDRPHHLYGRQRVVTVLNLLSILVPPSESSIARAKQLLEEPEGEQQTPATAPSPKRRKLEEAPTFLGVNRVQLEVEQAGCLVESLSGWRCD
jgi:hypothetical protein